MMIEGPRSWHLSQRRARQVCILQAGGQGGIHFYDSRSDGFRLEQGGWKAFEGARSVSTVASGGRDEAAVKRPQFTLLFNTWILHHRPST